MQILNQTPSEATEKILFIDSQDKAPLQATAWPKHTNETVLRRSTM